MLIVQENRSFDNLFATYPGADGATSGKIHTGKTIALKMRNLAGAYDINHDWKTFSLEYDRAKMDGFDLCKIGGQITKCGTYAYQYVDPSQIQPYWMLAQQYVLADHMFQTQGSGSFTAHQDLIAGTTAINATQSIIDYPSEWTVWGCDAPNNPSNPTVTSLMDYNQDFLYHQGPFPCFTYPTGTLADLLDKKGVSWKYYAPPYTPSNPNAGTLWNAFAAIDAVRHGPDWANISTPETNILNDVSNERLPALSWVIPDQPDSDHPNGPNAPDDGPSWVAQVVNAIGTSNYWNSTAIVVLWDDWGGFYDNVSPPPLDKPPMARSMAWDSASRRSSSRRMSALERFRTPNTSSAAFSSLSRRRSIWVRSERPTCALSPLAAYSIKSKIRGRSKSSRQGVLENTSCTGPSPGCRWTAIKFRARRLGLVAGESAVLRLRFDYGLRASAQDHSCLLRCCLGW